tara:strand:+ start:117 stop:416 length:300 start_codon:yes stop_codon:yes gene_type:complete
MRNLTILLSIFVLASCSGELSYNCNYVADIVISKDRSKLTLSLDGIVKETLYVCGGGEYTNIYGCETNNTFILLISDSSLVSNRGKGTGKIFAHYCLRT